jgi:hypothetical protein
MEASLMKRNSIGKLLLTAAPTILSLTGLAATAEAAAINCNGGVQKAILSTISVSNFSTSSSAFVAIPGASISVTTGGAGSDVYSVTFSGEASATGGGNWEIEAQRSIDGGAFDLIPPGTIITFHSGNNGAANAMSWCTRLSATTNLDFRILWRKLGGGTANIGAYTMQVLRSE